VKRILLWSSLFALACSSNAESLFDPSKEDGGPGSILTGADGPCGTREDKVGCACLIDGQSRECWPGSVGQSHTGVCRSGVQTCGSSGSKEFVSLAWGACTGFVLPSGGCGATGDGDGSGSGGHGHTDDGTGPGGFGGKTNDGQGGQGQGGHTDDGTGGTGLGGNGGHGHTDDGTAGSAGSSTGSGGHTGDGAGGNGEGGSAGASGGSGGSGGTSGGSGGASSGTGGSGGGTNGSGGAGGHGGTGGGSAGDAPCECPGVTRWCDEPVFCLWGQQTCLPDGSWGPCQEVKGAPDGCTEEFFFSGACCERRGICCEKNGTLFGPCHAGGCP
jgi:hypothetical protein